jgi:hypothetical protein
VKLRAALGAYIDADLTSAASDSGPRTAICGRELADRAAIPGGAMACADYLGWPTQRVWKHIREIPHYRHEQRLMFNRRELDEWIETHRARRA